MAIQLVGGISGSVAEVGAAAALPLHVASKPIPYGNLGHYRVARRFVPIASATAGANFIILRNPGANPVVLTRLRFRILQTGAPTAAIEHRIGAYVARSYTVADGTGIGTTLTLSGNNAKKRTSMGTTGVVITETNAAGGMTAGTKTLDVDPFAIFELWVLAALSTTAVQDSLYELDNASIGESHPLVLAQNEGICFQVLANLAALTGVVYNYEIGWAEVASF